MVQGMRVEVKRQLAPCPSSTWVPGIELKFLGLLEVSLPLRHLGGPRSVIFFFKYHFLWTFCPHVCLCKACGHGARRDQKIRRGHQTQGD